MDDSKKIDILLKQYELMTKSYDEYIKIFFTLFTALIVSVAIPFLLNQQFMSHPINFFLVYIPFVLLMGCALFKVSKEMANLSRAKCVIEEKANRITIDPLFDWETNVVPPDRIRRKTIVFIACIAIYFLFNLLIAYIFAK